MLKGGIEFSPIRYVNSEPIVYLRWNEFISLEGKDVTEKGDRTRWGYRGSNCKWSRNEKRSRKIGGRRVARVEEVSLGALTTRVHSTPIPIVALNHPVYVLSLFLSPHTDTHI